MLWLGTDSYPSNRNDCSTYLPSFMLDAKSFKLFRSNKSNSFSPPSLIIISPNFKFSTFIFISSIPFSFFFTSSVSGFFSKFHLKQINELFLSVVNSNEHVHDIVCGNYAMMIMITVVIIIIISLYMNPKYYSTRLKK